MARSLFFRLRYGIGHHIGKLSPKSYKRLKKLKNTYLYGYKPSPIPFSIIFMNPCDITKKMQTHKYKPKYMDHGLDGEVKSGNWDDKTIELSEHWKCKDMYRRFHKNEQWENTRHYENMRESGMSHNDTISHLKQYDILFENFNQYDYKYGKETGGMIGDEILVNISRDGTFIFGSGGTHRLCLAQISKLDRVPVRVMVRHKKWQTIREKIYELNNSNQPIPDHLSKYTTHPDIRHVIEANSEQMTELV